MASLMVPAYLIAYGVATLFYGLLSDRIGRRPIMIASLSAFILLTVLTGFSQSAEQLTTVRLLTGLGASGVVPLALALIGDLFPYRERGRPLRSEEHTSELQSLMRNSYAVFCLQKKQKQQQTANQT